MICPACVAGSITGSWVLLQSVWNLAGLLVEGPNCGISLKLLLFPSLVRQGWEDAWVKVGGRLRTSMPSSGVSWDDPTLVTRQVGKAKTCLDNLVVLENKTVLACSTVSVVSLSKSDLKAHLLVG